MGPKKDRKRKDTEDDTPVVGSSTKAAKMTKLTVSGLEELKEKLKPTKADVVEELEVKATGQGDNTVECFANDIAEIRKLLPKLKALSLDASDERDECPADVLKNVFKAYHGSKTLQSLSLNMDWVQFKGLDRVLTGFSKGDCAKLKESLAGTKDIPIKDFKKDKYSLSCLPGLKNLNLTMCEVERIDDYNPPTFNKLKFEVMILILRRYIFSKNKSLQVDIKLLGGHDDNENYSGEESEGEGSWM